MPMNLFLKNRGLLDAVGKGLSKCLAGPTVRLDSKTVKLSYGLTMPVEVRFERNSVRNKGVILFIEREPNIIWGCINLQEVAGSFGAENLSAYRFSQWYRDMLRPSSQHYNDVISKIQQEVGMSNLVQTMMSHYKNEDFRSWSKDPEAWELQEFQKTKFYRDLIGEYNNTLTHLQTTPPRFKLKPDYFTGFSCEVLLPVIQLDFKKGEVRVYNQYWCYKGGNFKGKGEVTIDYIDTLRRRPNYLDRINARIPLSFVDIYPESGMY